MRIAAVTELGRLDTDLVLFAIGWSMGWLLLWRLRPLPRQDGIGDGPRPSVAVIVPARNEAHALAELLPVLIGQLRRGDQLVVVDDGSVDGTASVARELGATVLHAPDPPAGWLGKPHACWQGASVTTAPIVLFVDADVRPAADLVDRIAARSARHPDAVVSVQPWHRTGRAVEQLSLLPNVVTLMGCGAFTVFGERLRPDVAFGPVLCMTRACYRRVGGHAAAEIRTMHTEDIGLARAAGRSLVHSGRPDTAFRMYPNGWAAFRDGWTRTIATGAGFTRWWLMLATFCWIASLAGGWIAAPIVYPLCVAQVWVLGRRAGSMSPVTALLYPAAVAAFVWIFLRSIVAVLLRRDVRWKGRSVAARSG